METIDILELKNYSPEVIKELLEQLKGPRVEIRVDKRFGTGEESISFFTYRLYAEASYAAHLLCFASQSFGYYTPCPTLIEPFRFVVDLRDIPALVKELHYIAAAYCNPDSAEYTEYFNKAERYYLDAFNNIVNSYVWGLLYMASEAIMKFNNEEAEEDEEDQAE
jgi:hypothetical protein